jgi:nitroreductase
MSKEVLENIHTRRSVRKFLDLPVEWELVANVLDAGRMAPSAGNLQDWKFIVTVDPEKRLKIAEACFQQYWISSAPVLISVCTQPNKSERYYGERGKELYSVLDAGGAIENMLLAAHSQRLGACMIAAFEEKVLKKTLAIPDSARPIAVIAIGYPADEPPMPTKLELSELVYFDKWNNKKTGLAALKGEYSQLVTKALSQAKKWAENALEKMKEVK